MSKKCIKCGAEIPDKASFCPRCTSSQIARAEAPRPRLFRKSLLYILFAAVAAAAVFGAIFIMERSNPGIDAANNLSAEKTPPGDDLLINESDIAGLLGPHDGPNFVVPKNGEYEISADPGGSALLEVETAPEVTDPVYQWYTMEPAGDGIYEAVPIPDTNETFYSASGITDSMKVFRVTVTGSNNDGIHNCFIVVYPYSEK